MARPLLKQSEVFAERIRKCDAEFRKYGSWSLLDEMDCEQANSRMQETSISQPALFAIQVGLADLWEEVGIRPSAIVGHSVGEIAAAFLSGGLSFEEACRVAYYRGHTMDRASSKGKMLAVGISEKELSHWCKLDDAIGIAAINGPASLTLSGDAQPLEALQQTLVEQGIFAKLLAVEYAFHSSHMDPVQEPLFKALANLRTNGTTIPMISTVTGQRVDGRSLDADYWWKNVRNSVRFADAMKVLHDQGIATIIELGPHPVLGFSITECFQAWGSSAHCLPSLHRDRNDIQCLLDSLGQLYVLGYSASKPQCQMFHRESRWRLPAYPFHYQRCWSESLESHTTRLEEEIHPLLGEPTHAPDPTWNGRLDLKLQPFLQDHRVRGVCVLPAAALIECGLSLVRKSFPDKPQMIERFVLHQPCILNEDKQVWLQASLDRAQQKMHFHTRDVSDWNWSSLATAGYQSYVATTPVTHEPLDVIESRCDEVFDHEKFYHYCAALGLEYGEAFRGVVHGRRRDGESLVRVRLPTSMHDGEGFEFHPALLDSCFHAMIAADYDFHLHPQTLYLPVKIDKIIRWKSPSRVLRAHAVLVRKTDKHMLSDVEIYDESGDRVLSLIGFLSQRVSGGRMEESLNDRVYDYVWEESRIEDRSDETSVLTDDSKHWIVFDDEGMHCSKWVRTKARSIDRITVVKPLNQWTPCDPGNVGFCPWNRDEWNRLWQSLDAPATDLVYGWGLRSSAMDFPSQDIDRVCRQSAEALLYLVQSWDQHDAERQARLSILTQQSQPWREEPVDVWQAPVVGLGRVIVSEYARLQTRLIDMPLYPTASDEVQLREEWDWKDGEDEILIRSGHRYARRFQPHHDQALPDDSIEKLPYRLTMGMGAGVSDLVYRTEPHSTVGEHQLEISVRAVGLNFSDVMKALQLYPGLDAHEVELGAECSGVVTRVGKQVTNWKVGDSVVAIAPGCFGKTVVVREELVASKPQWMTYEQAAAVPVAFLTAWHGLLTCGICKNMKPF